MEEVSLMEIVKQLKNCVFGERMVFLEQVSRQPNN